MTFLLLRVVRAILVSGVFPRVETFFLRVETFFPRVEMGGGVWLVRLVAGWNG